MNLFVVCWAERTMRSSAVMPTDVVNRIVRSSPHLGDEPVRAFTASSGTFAASWVTSPPHNVGAACRYAASTTSSLALFDGRPVLWSEDSEDPADGRGAIDAATYLGVGWRGRLDGRHAVVTYDDQRRRLTVDTDPLGSYALYVARAAGRWWMSPSAAALAAVVGEGEERPEAVASLLAAGYGISRQPRWSGVDALPLARSFVATGGAGLRVDGPMMVDELPEHFAGTFDARDAARTLVRLAPGLADWPGRTSQVGVTGGRDSRLVVAAVARASVAFDAFTSANPMIVGYPATPDVRVGRLVCDALGVPQRVKQQSRDETAVAQPERVLALLASLSSGTVNLGDVLNLGLRPSIEAFPISFTGAAGEISRAWLGDGVGHGRDSLVDALTDRIAPRWPAPMLNDDGLALVRSAIGAQVDEALGAGVRLEDVPDVVYLSRVSGKVAPILGMTQVGSDSVAPLWSHRLLPHIFGMDRQLRNREQFHLEVLRELQPALVDVPFEGTTAGWQSAGRSARLVRKARMVSGKVVREGRRRLGSGRNSDPLRTFVPFAQDVVGSSPAHPAWDLLDRGRVETLLSASARTLDTRSRRQLFRLVTVFGIDAPAPVLGAAGADSVTGHLD